MPRGNVISSVCLLCDLSIIIISHNTVTQSFANYKTKFNWIFSLCNSWGRQWPLFQLVHVFMSETALNKHYCSKLFKESWYREESVQSCLIIISSCHCTNMTWGQLGSLWPQEHGSNIVYWVLGFIFQWIAIGSWRFICFQSWCSFVYFSLCYLLGYYFTLM